MPLSVPCPKCQTVLRAPDDAAGKKVRCKKCEHRFVLPAPAEDVPMAEPVEEPPAAVAAPEPPPAEPAADPGNPFAFGDTGPKPALSDDRPARGHRDRPRDEPRRPARKAGSSGGKLLLIVALVGGMLVLGLAGGAAAVYVLFVKDARPVAATAPTQAKAPDTEPGTAADTGKEKETSRNRNGHRQPAVRDAGNDTAAQTTPTAAVAAEKSDRALAGGPPALGFQLPDPPKEPTQVVAKARDRLALDLPASAVKAVRFSYGNPPVAAVLWTSFAGFQGTGAKDAVDVYAIPTGRKSDRVEFPADGFTGPRLFELSPDGNRIAVEQPPGKLTVHDFDAKEDTLAGVDPFAGAEGLAGPASAFRFVTPDKLAVLDSTGSLAVWDLKSKQRIVTGTAGKQPGPKDPPPAVSPVAGDRLFVAAGGSLHAVGVGNGQPIGTPYQLPDGWAPVAVSADPLGKHAALAYRDARGASGLAILDVRDAKGGIKVNVALPAGAGTVVGVSFTGSDTLVVALTDNRAGAVLFDVENRVPAGYLRPASGPAMQFPDAVAGKLWWVLPDPANKDKSVLTSAEMPFEEFFGVMNQAKTAGKPVFLVLRPDGLGK